VSGATTHEAVLGGEALGAGLGREVVLGAGEAGEEDDGGDRAAFGGGREVDGERMGAGRGRQVGVHALDAAEAAALAEGREGHGVGRGTVGDLEAAGEGEAGGAAAEGRRDGEALGPRLVDAAVLGEGHRAEDGEAEAGGGHEGADADQQLALGLGEKARRW
jgi:hypothetical protein